MLTCTGLHLWQNGSKTTLAFRLYDAMRMIMSCRYACKHTKLHTVGMTTSSSLTLSKHTTGKNFSCMFVRYLSCLLSLGSAEYSPALFRLGLSGMCTCL